MKLFLSTVVLLVAAEAAHAQDFRVLTRVYDQSMPLTAGKAAKAPKPQLVSRSLTLFHAGKVYDSLLDLGEVIVLDQRNRSVSILNTSRDIATKVEFDEIDRMLGVARRAIEENINAADQRPELAEAIAPIQFQLSPTFEETYDANKHRLDLKSPFVAYAAACDHQRDAVTVATYLDYADWMCRLNYVLHPGAMTPEARLSLNAAMRRLKLVPQHIELQATLDARLHLTAAHEFTWKLETSDRKLIGNWEAALADERTRRVSLREYQSAVLRGR
jgi:hypothetical protein